MVYVFYRPDAEYQRQIDDFTRRLASRQIPFELIDMNTREGVGRAQSYGVVEFPSVMAVRDGDGQMLRLWSGIMPTISDTERYARNTI